MKRVKLWGVALAVVVALGVAAGVGAQTSASSHRFSGSVTLDSTPAAAGTSVVAIVDGSACGSGTVITNAAGSAYALDVPGDCAGVGEVVSFSVGGQEAAETGRWMAGGRTQSGFDRLLTVD